MKEIKKYIYSFIYLIFILFCFVQTNDDEIICPDLQSKCPSGTTCCTLDTGDFGCCPLPKAVCCSDHLHCCPENNLCDVERQLCLHKNENGLEISQPFLSKFHAINFDNKQYKIIKQEVICPDKKHSCPEHHTCCPIGHFWQAQYGCCPAEKAVCCSDHLHCCPHGTECDITEARCIISNFKQKTKIKEIPQLSIQNRKHHLGRKTFFKAQIMKSSTHFCNSWIKISCPAINKCCNNKQLNKNKLIKCIINTINNKCIFTEINYLYESKEEYNNKQNNYKFSIPKICPDKTICPSLSDTCCPHNDYNNGIITYNCCSMNKANCCSDRTCCPYGYLCTINSDSSSNCIRMKTRELFTQFFFN